MGKPNGQKSEEDMILPEAVNKEIRVMLSRLDFVQWDRFTESLEDDQSVQVYGWIKREDQYKDFILLTFYTDDHPLYSGFAFTTSSAKRTHQISAILNGTDSESERHNDCIRVEGEFLHLANAIRLK